MPVINNEMVSALPSGNPAQSSDLLLAARSGTSYSLTAGSVAALAPSSTFNIIPNASGSVVTTTGTITSGTDQLSVASAAGWSAGMGIAVANAGTGGNTDLITTVTNISGTTFTLGTNAIATATTQIVYHDDTAAIVAAIATGGPVYIPAGNYNITSELTISSPVKIEGSGPGSTTLWARYADVLNGIFTINYQITGGATTVTGAGCIIRDLAISQTSGITPTHGFAFVINSSSGTGFYTTGLHIENVHINNLYGGIYCGNNLISNWLRDIYIVDPVAYGIYYDVPEPGGDCHFENIEMTGANAGLNIIHSDTTEFSNLKINGSQITFAAPSSAADIIRVRFTDISVENSPTQSIDFGANGCTQVQFVGGILANGTLTNQSNTIGLQMIGTNVGNSNIGSLIGIAAAGSGIDYTPTVAAASGTFTTASATGRYFVLGKLVFLTIVLTVTSVGSASIGAVLSLPLAATSTASRKYGFVGREISQTGFAFDGVVDPANSTTAFTIKQYDNSFGLGNNYVVTISGFYESA